MAITEIAGIQVEVDTASTKSIYASIGMGGCNKCDCAYCRNFLIQLPGLFPPEVLLFFAHAGIDPNKDAEVYEQGELRPGIHSYGGEYYFICNAPPKTDVVTLQGGFQFAFTSPSPLAQTQFRNSKGACCFYFTCEVLWALSERTLQGFAQGKSA
jgi:hypothetical protein